MVGWWRLLAKEVPLLAGSCGGGSHRRARFWRGTSGVGAAKRLTLQPISTGRNSRLDMHFRDYTGAKLLGIWSIGAVE